MNRHLGTVPFVELDLTVRSEGGFDAAERIASSLAAAAAGDGGVLPALRVRVDEVKSPVAGARWCRDVLQPVLDARRAARQSQGGKRRAAARGSGGGSADSAEATLWGSASADSAEPAEWSRFSPAVHGLLAGPDDARAVIKAIFGPHYSVLPSILQLDDWAARPDLPEQIRTVAADALEQIDAGGKVDGLYKQVKQLVENFDTVALFELSPDQLGAQRTVHTVVSAVTLTEERITKLTVQELTAAARNDPAGAQSWAVVVAAARNLAAHVSAVNTELGGA